MFHCNIFKEAKSNSYFRKVLATAQFSQVVLMSLLPKEEIGAETHKLDQILVFVHGSGKAVLNGKEYAIAEGDLFLVPAGTAHNFVNTGNDALKLFTVYAPPAHKEGVVRKTKKEAEEVPE